jgi:hypothetical protein
MYVSECLNINSLFSEIFVFVQWVKLFVVVFVGWAMIFGKTSVGLSLLQTSFQLVFEVHLREQTILRNPVILGCWLVIIGVLEAGSIGVGEIEWHVRITIINSVQFFSFHVSEEIVLDNWALGIGGMLSSCGFSLNGITEREDVWES